MRRDIWQFRKAEIRRLSTSHLLEAVRRGVWRRHADLRLLEEIAQERNGATEEQAQDLDALRREIAALLSQPEPCEEELELPERVPHSNPTCAELADLTFRKNLPRLLAERPGQWVAYHGDLLVGFARTDNELYRRCRAMGIPDEEYIVRPIEDNPPDFIFLTDFP
jgi:hypothetical protein